MSLLEVVSKLAGSTELYANVNTAIRGGHAMDVTVSTGGQTCGMGTRCLRNIVNDFTGQLSGLPNLSKDTRSKGLRVEGRCTGNCGNCMAKVTGSEHYFTTGGNDSWQE